MVKAARKVSTSVVGGMATVHIGMKLSANYQTTDIQIGLSLPVAEGEDAQEALLRTHREVDAYFEKAAPRVIETVNKVRSKQKNKERHG